MVSRGKRFQQRIDQFIHSIRFRLALWFMLVLGVVMVTFSAFIYYRQAQDIRAIAVERLNFTFERILGPTHERESNNDQPLQFFPSISTSPTDTADSLPANQVVALQAANGSILQSNGILTPEQILQLPLPINGWTGIQQASIPKIAGVADTRYLFVRPVILQNGQISGYLLVGVPLDANNQLSRLLISLILGNLLTLGIALTGGFWLADRAMRPVRTISQAAQQISESDLHKRLQLAGRDELSELGNTFDGMLERLQRAFERQRQFTADASHELRTPLTIIDLESNRGLSSRRSVEEYERILRTVQSENQFMIRLVNNLLSLARMDAGQVSLKRERLDLGELVSDVVERMGPLAQAQGVALEVRELPEISIMGDHQTLVQMLSNLVENAIKYSASVTLPQVSIGAGKQEENGRETAWVKVSDNGIGISPEHLQHIFDRFYQVEASRSHLSQLDGDGSGQESSGTGLGLAIAQWVAKAHQGEIRVQSNAGKGSTFEVVLPAL
jgi:two-component system OmpR family sensor kinase